MRKDICVEKRGHWKRATNLRESTSGQMSEDLPDIRPDATALPADPSPATRGACDHISFRAGEHLRWFCPLLVLNRFPLVLVIVRLSANSGITPVTCAGKRAAISSVLLHREPSVLQAREADILGGGCRPSAF